jgi:hypothetical protein
MVARKIQTRALLLLLDRDDHVRKAAKTFKDVGDVDLAHHDLVEPVLVFVIGLVQVVGTGIADVQPFLVDQAEVDERPGTELHGGQDGIKLLLGSKFVHGVRVGDGAQLRDLFAQKEIDALALVLGQGDEIGPDFGMIGRGEHGIHGHAQTDERNQGKTQGRDGDLGAEILKPEN